MVFHPCKLANKNSSCNLRPLLIINTPSLILSHLLDIPRNIRLRFRLNSPPIMMWTELCQACFYNVGHATVILYPIFISLSVVFILYKNTNNDMLRHKWASDDILYSVDPELSLAINIFIEGAFPLPFTTVESSDISKHLTIIVIKLFQA